MGIAEVAAEFNESFCYQRTAILAIPCYVKLGLFGPASVGLVFNDIYCVNGRLTQLMEWLIIYLQ
jgi:hypothetical protein